MEEEEPIIQSTSNYLEYGDIIKIHASSNKELHQQTFFIKYIDSDSKISLINTSTLFPYILYYKENESGILRDESIEQIDIIWKSPLKGYIAQNGLDLHKWIDIYFGGDFPVIFTGEITEIQDDQMEVTIYPSLEIIYIDFEYKGLPEDKFIDKILIRSKPKYVKSSIQPSTDNNEVVEEEPIIEPDLNEPSMKFTETNESVINIPEDYEIDTNIKDILHNMYIDANDIVFDTGDIEVVNQVFELDANKRIYGLDEQLTNLLDEMLSTIPNNARTKSVMDNIERIISKFKYLRTEFSKIDEYGNIESALIIGLKDKPLVNKIRSLSSNLKWIIPVVSLNKHLYSDEEGNEKEEVELGIGEEEVDQNTRTNNLMTNLKELSSIQNDYYKNINNEGVIAKYPHLIKSIDKYTIPYSNIESELPSTIIKTQVESDIEAIIDNLQDFKTIVSKKSSINLQKYVIQKYNLGSSLTWIEGKKQLKKKQLTPNETIHIKSLLMMPEEIVRFSKIDLPTTNILQRSVYSQNYPMTYRIFNRQFESNFERIDINIENTSTQKKSKKVDYFVDDFNYEKREIETNIPFLSNFKNFTIENINYDELPVSQSSLKPPDKKYDEFLNKIVPNTYDLISLMQRYLPKNAINGFSLLEIVRCLEPFAIYPKNITYNSYVRIRYFIKQEMTKWKLNQAEKQKEYRTIREKKWGTSDSTDIHQNLFEVLKENIELQNKYYTTYKTVFAKYIQRGAGHPEKGARGANMIFFDDLGDSILSPQVMGLKTSEILNTLINIDSGKTLSTLIRILLSSLTIPDNILSSIQETDVSVDELEKIRPNSCYRRVLTKVYKSLRDLQNDNHKDIYYDKEFDKTPYDTLTKELKAKKEKTPIEEFSEYFAEVLVQKLNVPRNISLEMANTIIRGKKQVSDGEYAILETYPLISVKKHKLKEEFSNNDEDVENPDEDIQKPEIVKVYYIRTKNVWKKDDTIDSDLIFMDNNTLFCNLSNNDKCVKITKPDICQDTEEARRGILAKTRASLFKEFDERVDESLDSLKDKLEKTLKSDINYSKKIERMVEIQLYKENKYAFDLGEIDKNTRGDIHNHSKWEYLLDKILSQEDFTKKQNDILTFTDRFTREPMVETLSESPHWFYCRESNLKLLPNYIYELAKAFVTSGSDGYATKLKEVVRKYGTISDDGDSIVDGIGGSGRVIQKIDFVEEELFNDAGFRIQTKTVIEKDIDNIVQETIASNGRGIETPAAVLKKHRVFENEVTETIYNILTTICRNIGISPDGIEDDILRISSETINIIVVSEKKYIDKMKKIEKPKPYIQYKNQNIILIVAFVTLVVIQSAVPPFQPENTVPGCVLSFAGFPIEGGEDGNLDGLRYLACVLNISKSSIGVWSAIQSIKNPVQIFMDAMIKSISKHVIEREDVVSMFSKKREYLLLNPDGFGENGNIPAAHSIKKWTTFLPPIIPYKITDKLLGSSSPSDTFLQDLKKSLTKGDSTQWQNIGIIKTKLIYYTFAIIEYINNIVKKNNPLLNTSNSVPFLQNSCCNDLIVGSYEQNYKQTILDYFKDKEPTISKYVDIALKLSMALSLNDTLSLAYIFVHTIDTSRKSTIIPKTGHLMENIYQSFIYYCKFDNETVPIPEYLKDFVTTKPSIDYNPQWSILEKMKYFKENGKNYTINDLDRLMKLVNNYNLVETPDHEIIEEKEVQIPNIDAMLEYIDYLDDASAITDVIENPLKTHLRAVLTKYRPNSMSLIDNDETKILKNYLIRSNNEMVKYIYQFFDEYRGSISIKKIEETKNFIANFAVWEDDSFERMATMVRFTRNVIKEMSIVFPTMITTNKPILNSIPFSWDLSSIHCIDIQRFIELYYSPLLKFMGDESIKELLFETMNSLKILIDFINYIPVINPIQREGVDEKGMPTQDIFYSVFDKESIYLIFRYLFNSVIYEYLQKSNDPDIIKKDGINIRNKKREIIKGYRDTSEETKGVEMKDNDDLNYESEQLNYIQLRAGELENIKRKTVDLLVSFLSIEKDVKVSINKSYKTISERVIRTKLDEKKTITDYFKNMLDDERKVEYTLKKMKMGRWNIGMQKGVFQYDKDIYNKEHDDIINMLSVGGTGAISDYIIQPEEKILDIADLEMNEEKMADIEYENEEWGIQQFGEDYMDGNYYESDQAEEHNDFNDN